jgi:hypothetical protein
MDRPGDHAGQKTDGHHPFGTDCAGIGLSGYGCGADITRSEAISPTGSGCVQGPAESLSTSTERFQDKQKARTNFLGVIANFGCAPCSEN